MGRRGRRDRGIWKQLLRKSRELAAIRGGLDTIKLQVTATAEATKAVEQRFSRADLVGSAEFEFRRQQLTELYGPLYATLKTTKELYDLWMAHKIPEVNGPFKLLLAAKNKMSRDLITQKSYLIEGGRMPESFNRFVTSTTIWDLYAAPTPDGVVPEKLAEDKHSKFPEDFVDHVYEVTEKLKARLAALYSAYAIQTPSAMGPASAISPLD
jgi:hypothetical protein